MNNILSVRNLEKIYHTKNSEILAVKDFSLDIKDGEFIAIVGPSGCGKSTILNILGGLDTKSNGEIIFKDHCKIGYMLQEDCLLHWRDIYHNCLLGLEINNELNNETKKNVLNLLENYGLKDFIHSYPSQLSGGMRQKVVRLNKPTLLKFPLNINFSISIF